MKNILVAYASPHGSTAEIAAFMGRTFEAYDIDVTVLHADDVRTVEGYDAFIIGSAIHNSMWLPSLSRLMFRFERELYKKPTYLFITCLLVMEVGGREKALNSFVWQEALNKLNIPRKNTQAFAGKLNWSQITGDEKWIIRATYKGDELPSLVNGDYRNWQEIAAWVHDIAGQLHLPPDLSQSQSISTTPKDETITREEVEKLKWPDNPGEAAAI